MTRTSQATIVAAVIRATTDLLEDEGMSSVTIRAVAARAGVAPMSVYNHFGDKQGLLAAVAEEHFAILARDLAGLTDADPRRRLREAGMAVHDLMTAYPRSYDLMWVTSPGPGMLEAFTQLVHLVQYGQAAGVFIASDPNDLASAIWASIHGAIHMQTADDGRDAAPPARVSRADYATVPDIVEPGITAW